MAGTRKSTDQEAARGPGRTEPDLGLLASAERRAPSAPAEQEFFLPVHGFVYLTDAEVAILNHPAMQRLGTLYQLGHASLVYRGATHRRLEHVIGAVHVAQEMIDAVAQNYKRALKKGLTGGAVSGDPLSEAERVFVRLAALTHDVGHLPEGHTLEDELKLLNKHDGAERLAVVLDRGDWPGWQGVTLRELIRQQYAPWQPSIQADPVDLLLAIIAKKAPEELVHDAKRLSEVRISVCRDIVGNTICADLLDYLHRDWYHIGKPRHFERRLFHYMEIRRDSNGVDQFVISLGQRPKIRTDAVSAILGLLESRYELAEAVLFHRTKCSAAAMLERALFELLRRSPSGESIHLSELEKRLLDLSDEGMIDYLIAEAEERKVPAALRPLEGLRQRHLYKAVSTTFWAELPPDIAQTLIQLYTKSDKAEEVRNRAARLLESDFGLADGSVAIYCPDKGMNAKVAQVRVQIGGWIDTLSKWDADGNSLGGGHLDAQLSRFRQLWRVHVCLSPEEYARLERVPGLLPLFRQAVKTCVLGETLPQTSLDDSVSFVARTLATMSEGLYAGRKVKDHTEVAARSARPQLAYPSGAPSIGSRFE